MRGRREYDSGVGEDGGDGQIVRERDLTEEPECLFARTRGVVMLESDWPALLELGCGMRSAPFPFDSPVGPVVHPSSSLRSLLNNPISHIPTFLFRGQTFSDNIDCLLGGYGGLAWFLIFMPIDCQLLFPSCCLHQSVFFDACL